MNQVLQLHKKLISLRIFIRYHLWLVFKVVLFMSFMFFMVKLLSAMFPGRCPGLVCHGPSGLRHMRPPRDSDVKNLQGHGLTAVPHMRTSTRSFPVSTMPSFLRIFLRCHFTVAGDRFNMALVSNEKDQHESLSDTAPTPHQVQHRSESNPDPDGNPFCPYIVL
jgi:hypothetical protein